MIPIEKMDNLLNAPPLNRSKKPINVPFWFSKNVFRT